MIEAFPRAQEPITEPGALMSRPWLRFFADIWSKFGYQDNLPVYKDIFISASSIDYTGENVSNAVISGDVKGKAFPKDEKNNGYFETRLPKNINDGENVAPFIVFIPDLNTGSCIWTISIVAANDSGSIQSLVSSEKTNDCTGLQDKAVKVVFDDLSGTNFDNTTNLLATITRNGDNALDTLEGNAILIGCGFTHKIEGIGSHE